LNVLCICGSLRSDSYNRKLLSHAVGVLNGLDVRVRVASLDGIPPYNADLEALGMPDATARLRDDLDWANGIVFATPEYNNSIPGVLKNAIDWGSTSGNRWSGKVAALMGATVGNFGTVLAQAHLRQILVILNTVVVPCPFVYVPHAAEAFDSEGKLINPQASRNMEALLARLAETTRALTAG
jgi:chromate reductase, NAD(P)H dehydrogenase (quinone)